MKNAELYKASLLTNLLLMSRKTIAAANINDRAIIKPKVSKGYIIRSSMWYKNLVNRGQLYHC
ncbi:hypothetical protein BT09F20_46930 [Escherichia coli]|nr:hypothetical protein VEE18_13570 [Escherichia coli]